jgi:hypothetical protein
MTAVFERIEYPKTPFSLEVYRVDNGPGYWAGRRIVVLRDGQPIGEYNRNYDSFAKKTFCPFLHKGTWYALYSKDYTATRVARLTDTFEDWCGEKASGIGFCPVEFYVPFYYTSEWEHLGKTEIIKHWFDNDYKDWDEFTEDAKDSSLTWAEFGFLSGCYWGDDSSWKLRYIDFSELENKVLKISERFGYWELPDGSIRESVRIWGENWIRLKGNFSMRLDKPVPNEDFREGFFNEQPLEDTDEEEGEE